MPDEPTPQPEDSIRASDSSLHTDGSNTSTQRDDEEISFVRWVGELLVLVAIAFVLAQGVKTYLVQPFVIPSGSMIPTLQVGDMVLVNKFAYRFGEPNVGDVVVFIAPHTTKTDYIKRVVAVGGQTVSVSGGKLVVDGHKTDEDYTHGQETLPGSWQLPVRIPDGQVFLMGDNRTNSTDSRWFGPQPVSRVLGKAILVYWPLNDLHLL